jgi:hypothetical protein
MWQDLSDDQERVDIGDRSRPWTRQPNHSGERRLQGYPVGVTPMFFFL